MDMMLEQFKTIFDRPEKVKKLRAVILDLAVRGKLVEQNPDDEPASVLLERIKEEKERLIKEKKIKKEKALPEISEEEKPFELPSSWSYARLGSIGVTQTGSTPSTKHPEYFNGNIPFIKPADISNKGINYYNESLTKLGLEKGRLIQKNSVMMVCIGGSIGKNYYTTIDCSCNQQINTITPLGNIESKFIHYLLSSKEFYNKVLEYSTGSATPIINKGKWENIVIKVPPLAEQKRIVEKIDSLMALCDSLEESLEKKVHYGELVAKSVFNSVGNVSSSEELEEKLKFILENFKDISLGDNAVKELKNCILQLAVQGKLVEQNPNDEPAEVLLEKIKEEKEKLIKEKKIKKEKALAEISEEEKPFKLPNSWRWVRLIDISVISTGSTPLKSNDDYYIGGKIPWITSSATGKEYIDTCDTYITNKAVLEYNLTINPVGTLIVAMYGQGKTRGQVSELLFNSTTNQACATVNLINKEMKAYVKIFLKKIYSEIRELAVGGAQPNLNLLKIKKYVIPIPPLEEQKRIVEKVDSLMALCDELEKKIEEQKEYSNKLMESIIKNSF